MQCSEVLPCGNLPLVGMSVRTNPNLDKDTAHDGNLASCLSGHAKENMCGWALSFVITQLILKDISYMLSQDLGSHHTRLFRPVQLTAYNVSRRAEYLKASVRLGKWPGSTRLG